MSIPVPATFYVDVNHEDHTWRLNGMGRSKTTIETCVVTGGTQSALFTFNNIISSIQFSYVYQYSMDWQDVL